MNKKQKLNLILFTSFILAAFLLWGNGIYKQQYLRDNYDSYSIRMKTEGITSETLTDALLAEQRSEALQVPVVCAWNYIRDQKIENDALEKSTKANLYEIYGEMKLASISQLLAGYFPDEEDYEGCIISDTLAFELFNSDHVLEEVVTYQSTAYRIRGIVKDEDAIIFIRSEDESKTYKNLEFQYGDNENTKLLLTGFLAKNAWTDSCVVLNHDIYMFVLEVLGVLPVSIISMILFIIILREIWKRRRIPIQVIALSLVFLVTAVIFHWGCNLSISIPDEFIPTKWSDFSFWVTKYREIEATIQAAIYVEAVPKDVLFRQLYMKGIHFDIFGTIFIIIALIYEKIFLGIKNLLLLSIFLVIIESLAIAVLFFSGIIFEFDRGYLFSLPIYFIFRSIRTGVSNISDKKAEL